MGDVVPAPRWDAVRLAFCHHGAVRCRRPSLEIRRSTPHVSGKWIRSTITASPHYGFDNSSLAFETRAGGRGAQTPTVRWQSGRM